MASPYSQPTRASIVIIAFHERKSLSTFAENALNGRNTSGHDKAINSSNPKYQLPDIARI
jgi:hypothetical protein